MTSNERITYHAHAGDRVGSATTNLQTERLDELELKAPGKRQGTAHALFEVSRWLLFSAPYLLKPTTNHVRPSKRLQ
jgi:hypothetical protein